MHDSGILAPDATVLIAGLALGGVVVSCLAGQERKRSRGDLDGWSGWQFKVLTKSL